MRKNEIFSAQLCIENGKPCAKLRNENQVTSIKVLLNVLDELRINRQITSGKLVQRDDHIDYIYEIKTTDENKDLFVIKIKNSEKELYNEAIKYLDSLCDLSVTLRKVNIARIAAGIVAGIFILVNAGPHVVKGIGDVIGQNTYHELTEEQQEEMRNIMHEGIYYPTEEEKKEAEEWYYEHIETDELSDEQIKGKTM